MKGIEINLNKEDVFKINVYKIPLQTKFIF